jgi:hypothetical protein
MSDTLVVLPDWLACLSEWLRDQDEVTDLVDQRVYTELPATKTYPLVRVAHLTDPSATPGVHWAVDCLFQIDIWGGPKAITWTIGETIRALLMQRFAGQAHDLTAGQIVAGRVRAGGIRRDTDSVSTSATDAETDTETTIARPRASFDAAVILHPAPGTGS